MSGFQVDITTDFGLGSRYLKIYYLTVDPSFTDPFSSSYFSFVNNYLNRLILLLYKDLSVYPTT